MCDKRQFLAAHKCPNPCSTWFELRGNKALRGTCDVTRGSEDGSDSPDQPIDYVGLQWETSIAHHIAPYHQNPLLSPTLATFRPGLNERRGCDAVMIVRFTRTPGAAVFRLVGLMSVASMAGDSILPIGVSIDLNGHRIIQNLSTG